MGGNDFTSIKNRIVSLQIKWDSLAICVRGEDQAVPCMQGVA